MVSEVRGSQKKVNRWFMYHCIIRGDGMMWSDVGWWCMVWNDVEWMGGVMGADNGGWMWRMMVG